MIRNQKICFFISICFILLSPGFSVSEENKKDQENTGEDKTQIAKLLKSHADLNSTCTNEGYTMKIIRPYPNIDPGIVKNTYDPSIDYKLRIIGPYCRKEITGKKGTYFGFLQNKFLPKGREFKTLITIPAK